MEKMPKKRIARHRRSMLACMKLHRQKMKCDVMAKGQPCSRCSNTGDQCHLFPSKRLHEKNIPYQIQTGKNEESHSETANCELATSPEVPRTREIHDGNIPVTEGRHSVEETIVNPQVVERTRSPVNRICVTWRPEYHGSKL